MIPTRDGYLDAIAWLEATINEDHEGKMAIALNTDPVMLVETLTLMYLSLIRISTYGQEIAYVAMLRENLDAHLANLDKLKGDDQ